MSKSEWKLSWNDKSNYIMLKEIGDTGEVLTELSLDEPRFTKLYYALDDWFGDRE